MSLALGHMATQYATDRERGNLIAAAVVDLLTGTQTLDEVRLPLARALLRYDSTDTLFRALHRCPACGTRGRTQDVPVPITGTDDYADTALCTACDATWGIDPGADGLCEDCGGSGTRGARNHTPPCRCTGDLELPQAVPPPHEQTEPTTRNELEQDAAEVVWVRFFPDAGAIVSVHDTRVAAQQAHDHELSHLMLGQLSVGSSPQAIREAVDEHASRPRYYCLPVEGAWSDRSSVTLVLLAGIPVAAADTDATAAEAVSRRQKNSSVHLYCRAYDVESDTALEPF